MWRKWTFWAETRDGTEFLSGFIPSHRDYTQRLTPRKSEAQERLKVGKAWMCAGTKTSGLAPKVFWISKGAGKPPNLCGLPGVGAASCMVITLRILAMWLKCNYFRLKKKNLPLEDVKTTWAYRGFHRALSGSWKGRNPVGSEFNLGILHSTQKR